MSESNSYFDWELSFRKNNSSIKNLKVKHEEMNSIGIPSSKCKQFLKEWREKNLS
jgi:hypothetical protein